VISFLKSRAKSFKYAISGFWAFFKQESNGRIHLAAAVLISALGWYFEISRLEWCIQCLCIAMVIALEMINSAIEKSIDLFTSDIHPNAKYVKDVSAAAVLVVAVISLIAAALIYVPKFNLI